MPECTRFLIHPVTEYNPFVIQFNGIHNKGVVFGDGVDQETRAFGLFGGKEGSINEMEFSFPGGKQYRPRSKELIADIPKGTVLRQVAGGGGGYGDPRLRPAEMVAKEVRNGVLSIEMAKAIYGVVINPVTYEIDIKGTERLRNR